MMRIVGKSPLLGFAVRKMLGANYVGPKVAAFGLTFQNPVGLAAGYDKNGLGWRGLVSLGFGHIEVGTVTTLPQSGGPHPRVFRLVEDEAIINRMGFPNQGSAFLVKRLQGLRPAGLILGVNIGKHASTPLEEAVGDYLNLFKTFAPLADYLAINISSPNTHGLRALQAREPLERLLGPLVEARSRFAYYARRYVPLLVKLAPDLTEGELDDALDVILRTRVDGVIVANTSLQRRGVRSPLSSESGGLSGAPIGRLNTKFVCEIVRRTNGKLPVVASGGVMTPQDAIEKLDAGAALVQLYTGLVYNGPGLVGAVLRELSSEKRWVRKAMSEPA